MREIRSGQIHILPVLGAGKIAVVNNTLIYPNPVVESRFAIITKTALIGKDVQLKLINLMGQTVYSKSVRNNTGTIDVVLNQSLRVGIYTLINC